MDPIALLWIAVTLVFGGTFVFAIVQFVRMARDRRRREFR